MKSFEVKIFVGFKEYTNIDRTEHILHDLIDCEHICQDYCNNVGLCVTVTPTKYIYTNGSEPGAIVGLIQYPRFPKDEDIIVKHAYELADELMVKLGQYRVTINSNDCVHMLTNNNK